MHGKRVTWDFFFKDKENTDKHNKIQLLFLILRKNDNKAVIRNIIPKQIDKSNDINDAKNKPIK